MLVQSFVVVAYILLPAVVTEVVEDVVEWDDVIDVVASVGHVQCELKPEINQDQQRRRELSKARRVDKVSVGQSDVQRNSAHIKSGWLVRIRSHFNRHETIIQLYLCVVVCCDVLKAGVISPVVVDVDVAEDTDAVVVDDGDVDVVELKQG